MATAKAQFTKAHSVYPPSSPSTPDSSSTNNASGTSPNTSPLLTAQEVPDKNKGNSPPFSLPAICIPTKFSVATIKADVF